MIAYHQNVQSNRVDGFVIVRTRRQDERIQYLSDAKFPFVAFGRTEKIADYFFVDEDREHGMRLLAHHLADLGHQNISYISAPDHLMLTHYSLKGFREGLEEKGLQLSESRIAVGDMTQRSGYSQAMRFLDMPDPPTAIAACNDLMALGAISAAQERGLVVGKDIAITGFDNIPLAEYSHPQLTTIHQPIYQIGAMVCEMLIQHIQGKVLDKEQILLTPTLVVRQSCGVRYARGT